MYERMSMKVNLTLFKCTNSLQYKGTMAVWILTLLSISEFCVVCNQLLEFELCCLSLNPVLPIAWIPSSSGARWHRPKDHCNAHLWPLGHGPAVRVGAAGLRVRPRAWSHLLHSQDGGSRFPRSGVRWAEAGKRQDRAAVPQQIRQRSTRLQHSTVHAAELRSGD